MLLPNFLNIHSSIIGCIV